MAAENRGTNEAVLEELKKITASSTETKIRSVDPIQKLLSLLEKSTRAGVRQRMQSCQIVDGERTFMSKWAIICRAPPGDLNRRVCCVIVRLSSTSQASLSDRISKCMLDVYTV